MSPSARPACRHASLGAVLAVVVAASPSLAGERGPDVFSGCGTIGFGPQGCLLFVADDTGAGYLLDNLGDFSFGDHVAVEGVVEPDLVACFPVVVQKIVDNSIESCPLPASFIDCGTIVQTAFCGLALEAESGGTYVLDDVGGFVPGDVVAVAGNIDKSCITIPECQVTACLEVVSIVPCGEGYFAGCGTLSIGPQGCVTFFPQDVPGTFTLASYGGFIPGQTVRVSGSVTPEVFDCFPFLVDRIENATIEICCPDADLTGDCLVDGADLGAMLAAWGTCPLFGACAADLNHDLMVDGT
ncbi:MAG: hypothetical protein KDA22_01280, partial [Phycisphaerales bacterium]|nr:hypothetical protein [Phycisphaerales bacterium]